MTQRSRKPPRAEGRAAEETAEEAGGLSPRLLVARRSLPTPSLSISIPSRPILFRCLLGAMSLFQSALDFLAGPGSLGAASRDQNDFVGQTVEMGDMKLRIKRVIAEGKSGRQGRALWGGPSAAGLGWASPGASRSRFPVSYSWTRRVSSLAGRARVGAGGRQSGRRFRPPGKGWRCPCRSAPGRCPGTVCQARGSQQCLVLLSCLRNSRREPLGCVAASSLASWFKMPSPHNRAQRCL